MSAQAHEIVLGKAPGGEAAAEVLLVLGHRNLLPCGETSTLSRRFQPERLAVLRPIGRVTSSRRPAMPTSREHRSQKADGLRRPVDQLRGRRVADQVVISM